VCMCVNEQCHVAWSCHKCWSFLLFRLSQLFAGLEVALSNSSAVDNLVDILNDVDSLRSLGNYMVRVSNSCKFCLYLSADHTLFIMVLASESWQPFA